jgi:hypothetical protein
MSEKRPSLCVVAGPNGSGLLVPSPFRPFPQSTIFYYENLQTTNTAKKSIFVAKVPHMSLERVRKNVLPQLL